MNEVLRELLGSPEVKATGMSPTAFPIIKAAFEETRPSTSVEVGFGFGVSTLYACEILSGLAQPCVHIVMDPVQTTGWHSLGLTNLERAGYRHLVRFIEEGSEMALPSLLREGVRVQAAIIDGVHTFDHALIDFFYVNKMLDVGGIVIFDDTDYPGIARLIRHIETYPCYERFADDADARTIPPTTLKTIARQKLAAISGMKFLKREWDERSPRCVALKKIDVDNRNWDWHDDF